MKRKLELWRDTDSGKITDEWGMEYSIPQLEEASVNSRLFKVGSLDSVGDWTLTGNLTVQSSQWVYLRGPITSSRGLFNGPLTASSLWIRDRSGDASSPQESYGSVKIDGDIEVGGVSLKGQMEKINGLDAVLSKCNGLEEEIVRLKREIEMLRKKVNG
jgi:hypothetical protein